MNRTQGCLETGLDASRRLIAPYPWGSRRGRRIELVGMGRDSVSCSKITKYDVLRVSGSIRLYRLGVPSESFYSYRMRAASLDGEREAGLSKVDGGWG